MERELLIPAQNIAHQIRSHEEHVFVDRVHLLEGDLIALRIEAIKVAEDPAECIADVAVVITHALHQLIGSMHVLAEVH